MKGADKTKQYVETLSRDDKEKLLQAADTIEGFQGICIILLILAVVTGLLYGAYCLGYQDGGYAMRTKSIEHTQCVNDSDHSFKAIDKCYDTTLGAR